MAEANPYLAIRGRCGTCGLVACRRSGVGGSWLETRERTRVASAESGRESGGRGESVERPTLGDPSSEWSCVVRCLWRRWRARRPDRCASRGRLALGLATQRSPVRALPVPGSRARADPDIWAGASVGLCVGRGGWVERVGVRGSRAATEHPPCGIDRIVYKCLHRMNSYSLLYTVG